MADRESYDSWIRNRQRAARILLEATGSEVPDYLNQEVEREAMARLLENFIRVEKPRGKLTSNLPNVFSAAMPQKGENLDDDVHAEFNLSIKYPLVDRSFRNFRRAAAGDNILNTVRPFIPSKLYFIYNGRYDFYLFPTERYRSAPVISRLQNPGLAFEWNIRGDHERIRFGWFHESNGQSIDNIFDYEAQRDELGSDREPKGDEFALAQVSRGWDYAQLRYELSKPDMILNSKSWWRYNVELRLFCDCQALWSSRREDDIFWKPVAEQPKIRDYDGLRVMMEYGLTDNLLFRGEFKTGISDLDSLAHFGGRISLGYLAKRTRFSLFYFNGYGKEPSTYHLRTRYAGIGLELR